MLYDHIHIKVLEETRPCGTKTDQWLPEAGGRRKDWLQIYSGERLGEKGQSEKVTYCMILTTWYFGKGKGVVTVRSLLPGTQAHGGGMDR